MNHLQGWAALAICALALSPTGARSREPLPPPPGTVIASPIAFAGGWQLIINRTETYTLVLQIPNSMVNPLVSDLYVTGQLVSKDNPSQLNGSLQGTIPRATRTLHFSFAQPGANRGGSGQLALSPDGSSITGNSKTGEVYSTWRGRRAQ